VSLHDDSRRVLLDWQAPDSEQEALRALFLEHLAAREDATSRGCHPDHLTASALVFSHDQRQVALTLHAKLGRWLQTGGHCEPDDARLVAAACREAREESGVSALRMDAVPVLLSRHEVRCGPLRPAHHLDVQFVAVADRDAVLAVSEESTDVRWFAVDDLPADADHSVRALVIAGARRLRESP